MNRLERFDNLQVALQSALNGRQAETWTALPGTIESFDPTTKTCTVQPGLRLLIKGPAIASLIPGANPTTIQEGQSAWMTLPVLVDCPVHFPSGGGYTLTFPVAKGDECLVVFSSRCIDAWYQTGGVQNQALLRMHDLSDGMVFVGFSSLPNVQPNISTTSVQLRDKAGSTVLDFKSGTVTLHSANVIVDATTTTVNSTTTTVNSTTATVTAPTVNVNATTATVSATSIILQNTGAALKYLLTGAFLTAFNAHKHSGVTTGSGTTGTVNTPVLSTGNVTTVVQAE